MSPTERTSDLSTNGVKRIKIERKTDGDDCVSTYDGANFYTITWGTNTPSAQHTFGIITFGFDNTSQAQLAIGFGGGEPLNGYAGKIFTRYMYQNKWTAWTEK